MGDHNNDDQSRAPPNPLKSRRSNVKAFVSFKNSTDRIVDVIWMNFAGQRQTYTENGLAPGRQLNMHTFEGHPWIVRDKVTGDTLEFVDHGVGRLIYMPERWDGERFYRAPIIKIRVPIYSLYERSLQIVRQLIHNQDNVDELEIPKQVKYDLCHVRDIIPQAP
ncbi:von Hippel-Lindau disease tumor suppressor-like [Lytechinus pictus]|uniref:von Hippel-Lindau disease tumor suppressor-like n=1 Tax=Lytechinus pictus TaxID=7653 RepID=UPI0030B9E511